MDVFDAVRELKSVRTAEEQVVPRPIIGKIIEAGRHAPSPGNVQSLEFIVVDSDESKGIITQASGDERLEDVPTALVILADMARMRRRVGPADTEIACYSEAACAAQNMRLVAEEDDVATCWVTGFDQVAVKEHFGIPEEKQPVGLLGLCYSDDRIESEDRFGMGEIVFYEHYKNQMRSNFDDVEWKGYYENKKIVNKRLKGAVSKLKNKFGDIL